MDKKIILFGTGIVGKRALMFYGEGSVCCFVDNNNSLKEICGKPVIGIEELKSIYKNYSVVLAVSKLQYMNDIATQLTKSNIPYRLFVEEEEAALSKSKSNKEIFSEIYTKGLWGGRAEFYSGIGSHDATIIRPYIDALNNLIQCNDVNSICDIGCGDFNIMKQVITANPMVSYTGIDVVCELVQHNQSIYGNNKCSFVYGDVVDDDFSIPEAELVIVRQVLQHHSNANVKNILDKINKTGYKYLVITEEIYDKEDVCYNIDKMPGKGIRLYKKSGIYIEQPPFSLRHVVHLLKINNGESVIRTSLVINQ